MKFTKWQKISEKKLFGNDYWDYKLDVFKMGDKEEKEYHYVHTLGSTMVVPKISTDKFLLLKQYRYLNKKFSIEFPSGGISKGFSPKENALKELREETGYAAKTLTEVATFNPYNGVTDELCHLFVADELYESPLPPDDTEEFEPIPLNAEEINSMILTNEIWDGMTLASWTIFKTKFGLK
jgi:8-oxo-dGTP pyrophosphatase MutT (NUDIX family)